MGETGQFPSRLDNTVFNLIPLVTGQHVVVIAQGHVPGQMANAGMGVDISPLLRKLLVEGSVHPRRVHVVPGGDDEVASVPEAEVPNILSLSLSLHLFLYLSL